MHAPSRLQPNGLSPMTLSVAVTGGTGFIGQHVLRALIARGVRTTAISRNSDRLIEFREQIKIVEMDLGHSSEQSFEALGCPDVLIHLAWDGLPNYRSRHHFESELSKQYSFLKTLVSGGLKTLLTTGTCFEYGMRNGSLSESEFCQPDNAYAYSKDALRKQLTYLKTTFRFNLTWARIFYLYGQGQAESSLWSLLHKALERGDTTFPMSGGEQLRDFSPVEEVAETLVALALGQGDFGIVNICSGRPRSVRSMVELWTRQSGRTIELELGRYPYPDYEPMAFWGDRTKLDSLLERQ